jgi:hypothetical protein
MSTPCLTKQVRDAPKIPAPTRGAIQPAGFRQESNNSRCNGKSKGGVHMGVVMIKCPQTGRAIPTGIKTDRDSFGRSAVFFARTRCPICQAEHAWFARDAWVDEPGPWILPRSARFQA